MHIETRISSSDLLPSCQGVTKSLNHRHIGWVRMELSQVLLNPRNPSFGHSDFSVRKPPKTTFSEARIALLECSGDTPPGGWSRRRQPSPGGVVAAQAE